MGFWWLHILMLSPAHSMTEETAHFMTEENVSEISVADFNYTPGKYNDHIGIQNVVLTPDNLHMRSGVHTEALLRWDLPNTTENWSFEIIFNNLSLANEESAELYLRYMAEKPLLGSYEGGQEIFNGMMIGLRFSGKSVTIVYGKNDGQDFSVVGDFHTIKDHVNPRRFKDVKEYRLKIISTNLNIKAEIYDNDTLIYDHFKLFDVEKHGLYKPGKYFGIIAHYGNTPSSKSFVLRGAQLFKRIEKASYNKYTNHTKPLDTKVRAIADINHHDSGVKELIYQLELMTSYIKTVVGDLPDTRLAVLERDLRREIESVTGKIEKLKGSLTGSRETRNDMARINELDIKILNLRRSASDIEHLLSSIIEAKRNETSFLKYGVFATGCLLLYILACREYGSVKALSNAITK